MQVIEMIKSLLEYPMNKEIDVVTKKGTEVIRYISEAEGKVRLTTEEKC